MNSRKAGLSRALPEGYLLHRRYEIGKVLGEGGFGITYKAWDRQEMRQVAVKEYMPIQLTARVTGTGAVSAVRDPEHYEKYKERFLKEAQIIYKYRKHPNVVSVYHLFYENNTAYYVMEYLEGTDLYHMAQKNGGKLSWESLRPVISQVVAALYAVHKEGIVHCDISPDNIFLRDGGQVKLIDFGAAQTDAGGRSSMVILKQGYAPPEQYSANISLGSYTDIYALAVTIYRCLTGQMPPKAPERLCGQEVLSFSQLGIHPGVGFNESVLGKAMALSREERYHDVTVFFRELCGGQQSPQGPPQPVQPIQQRASHPIQQRTPQHMQQPAQNQSHRQYQMPVGRYLLGRAGVWEGRILDPQEVILAGTDRTKCRILFPEHTPGVGTVHFRIWKQQGSLFVMDMGSGYVTYLEYMPLKPGLVYEMTKGQGLRIGDNQIFEVM